MSKKVISTKKAPAAVGPYSQAMQAGGFVFISGQLGLDPETGKFVEGGVEAQAGLGFGDVVKTTVLLDSMDDFKAVNAVYAARFPENPPARAAFAVQTLPLNGLVEIEAVALIP